MSRILALPGLAAAGYERHALHAEERLWVEKNCYVDVVIELLHALRLEPLAALGCAAALDFEGDNFTFLKPQHEELRVLYGVDVQELNVWRPLLVHVEHYLAAGRFVSTEADSFWLPDTAGTDYRRNHVKSTIIVADVDAANRRLGYFHNAAYYELTGEDFDHTFRLGPPDPAALPLFAELVKVDRLVRRAPGELAAIAAERLAVHVQRRPAVNPIDRFAARFAQDLPALQEAGLAHYHAWAFATTRQLGASMELLALHLRWLVEAGDLADLGDAADAFLRLSASAKTFILKAARAVNAKKPLDASPLFGEMAACWNEGMAAIDQRVATVGTGVR